jgi:hypothetical protein
VDLVSRNPAPPNQRFAKLDAELIASRGELKTLQNS